MGNYVHGGGASGPNARFGADCEGHNPDAFKMGRNQVIGCLLSVPTNASTIDNTTPAHEFHANLSDGIVILDGVELNIAAEADIDVSKSASASPLTEGQSIYYTIVYYKDTAGNIERRIHAGTAALTAAAVPLTVAEIAAKYAVPWIAIGHVKYNNTAADTVTQSQDNTPRPTGNPNLA